MALTRPNASQVNTRITAVSDPITVLNQGAISANVDVGFLFNRANGLVSNVALYWSESAQSIVTAFTSNTGVTNSNISPSSYANLTIGNLLMVQGSILGVVGNLSINRINAVTIGNTGAQGIFGNVSTSGTQTVGNIITTSGVFWANGSAYTSGSAGIDTLATVTARGNTATSNIILPNNEGNAFGFGATSDAYSIAMGTTAATYQYGTVSDSSIKMCMSGGTARGFTWGQNGVKPVASLNSTSGNMQIAGTFSAATKSFLIPHPTKPGMQLRYGSLESPYHGIRLTGDAILIDGMCIVKLPDYIHGLCKQDGSQVQITNIKHGNIIWIEDINISKDEFTVKSNIDLTDRTEYKFYWSFTAIRKDIADMEVEIK